MFRSNLNWIYEESKRIGLPTASLITWRKRSNLEFESSWPTFNFLVYLVWKMAYFLNAQEFTGFRKLMSYSLVEGKACYLRHMVFFGTHQSFQHLTGNHSIPDNAIRLPDRVEARWTYWITNSNSTLSMWLYVEVLYKTILERSKRSSYSASYYYSQGTPIAWAVVQPSGTAVSPNQLSLNSKHKIKFEMDFSVSKVEVFYKNTVQCSFKGFTSKPKQFNKHQ